MPIECDIPVRSITRDAYHDLDYEVMRLAFQNHADLGCLHDETIYQRELAHRCAGQGIKVDREVPIRVSFDSFAKTYFMDCLLNKSKSSNYLSYYCLR